jgi:hypothetical protein
VRGADRAHPARSDALDQQLDLALAVLGAAVDRDRARQPIAVENVVDMALEVDHALPEGGEVLVLEIGELYAAVEFQRPHRRHDHRGTWLEAGLAALDVDELLRSQIGAEARLGHHVVHKLQRGARGEQRVAPVRDVRERPAVHEGGVVGERLHQVGCESILQ